MPLQWETWRRAVSLVHMTVYMNLNRFRTSNIRIRNTYLHFSCYYHVYLRTRFHHLCSVFFSRSHISVYLYVLFFRFPISLYIYLYHTHSLHAICFVYHLHGEQITTSHFATQTAKEVVMLQQSVGSGATS